MSSSGADWRAAFFGFRIPMRGYEANEQDEAGHAHGFRIPMRGYEGVTPAVTSATLPVPNPHEGL